MSSFEDVQSRAAADATEQIMETLEEIERRHKAEIRELEGKVRALLKTAKKANKSAIEAQTIQMEYDLKAKHREEMELFEERIEALGGEFEPCSIDAKTPEEESLEEQRLREEQEVARAKKAKAQKKKEKKVTKETERLQKKEEISSQAGPSLREIELERINLLLSKEKLQVKDVLSDGHCLYRAIADQLQQLSGSSTTPDFVELRRVAAQQMRENSDEFAPFLGLDASDSEFESYCSKVESVAGAEWGGQLEINALCAALGRQMLVYSADAPILKMGSEEGSAAAGGGLPPIQLTFHRTYYALGEHYNSVEPIAEEDS